MDRRIKGSRKEDDRRIFEKLMKDQSDDLDALCLTHDRAARANLRFVIHQRASKILKLSRKLHQENQI